MAQYKKRTNPTNTIKNWTDINGKMHVYGQERTSKGGKPFIGYSTSIGYKVDDEWENFYLNVRFPKNDPEIIEGFDVELKNAFISLNVWEDKKKQKHIEPVIVVMEYELL